MTKQYDIVIIGGGLVGAGFAAALLQSGLKIALVEAKLPNPQDPRLLALNYHSCQFLKNVGIWSALENKANAIERIHVSKKGRFGSVRLNREDVGLDYLGQVIPARDIEAALQQKLSQSEITLYQPAKLIRLLQTESQATLTIETETKTHQLQTPLVIAADGTHSTTRNLIDIEVEEFDYQQSALVTITELNRQHENIAFERFTEDGAIAMLPLAATENTTYRVATIWSGSNALINKLYALPEAEFVSQLQENFGYRLGKLKAIAKRYVYPLKMLRAKNESQGCVLLLGNAAHTLHPIAAQGFNLALYEVATIVAEIKKLLQQQMPLTLSAIKSVQTAILRQQSTSIGVSHKLATLFASDSQLVSFALHLGMLGLDKLPIAKRSFMQRVLGRTGRLPRLLLSAEDYDHVYEQRNS